MSHDTEFECLDELLREEGQLRRQSESLEAEWLEQNEALEQLEASLEQSGAASR